MKIISVFLLGMTSFFADAADIGFGTYGNWCGINHPTDPSRAEAPVDPLDASCQRHDQCYVDKGQFSCECDAALQKELSDALKANQYQGETKHFARTAHHYFKGSPCNGTPSSKLAPTRVIQNLLNKGKKVVDKLTPATKVETGDTATDKGDAIGESASTSVSAPDAPLAVETPPEPTLQQ